MTRDTRFVREGWNNSSKERLSWEKNQGRGDSLLLNGKKTEKGKRD